MPILLVFKFIFHFYCLFEFLLDLTLSLVTWELTQDQVADFFKFWNRVGAMLAELSSTKFQLFMQKHSVYI